MSRNKVLMITAAVIFLGAVIWCAVILLKPKSNIVNITQDGTLLYSLDLSREKDRTFTVEYKGRKNTVEIKDGRIRICHQMVLSYLQKKKSINMQLTTLSKVELALSER